MEQEEVAELRQHLTDGSREGGRLLAAAHRPHVAVGDQVAGVRLCGANQRHGRVVPRIVRCQSATLTRIQFFHRHVHQPTSTKTANKHVVQRSVRRQFNRFNQ